MFIAEMGYAFAPASDCPSVIEVAPEEASSVPRRQDKACYLLGLQPYKIVIYGLVFRCPSCFHFASCI